MLGRFRARDAEQPVSVLLSDTGQRVAHLLLLGAQLLLVGDVLIAAAAALVRDRAAGVMRAREGVTSFSTRPNATFFVTLTIRTSQQSPTAVRGTNTARPSIFANPAASAV